MVRRRRVSAAAGAAPRKELEIRNGNANPEPDDPALREVLQMGIADAQQALRLARRNAAAWRIDPARVGIMGFSAGGGVAVGTALAERSDASPDFLVSLYGPSLQDVNVPAHAPPLFIAVGSSHFNVTNGCLALFAAWKAAGKPAEIHVYDQVSAGFGMTKRGLPVDSWNDRLLEWLMARKLRDDRNEAPSRALWPVSARGGVRRERCSASAGSRRSRQLQAPRPARRSVRRRSRLLRR